MIIVTQDRETVINFKNVISVELIENKKVIRCETGKINYWLGNYKTEERAKEVLQEILNTIMGNKLIEISSNLGDMTKANRMGYELTPVYEMPLE